jgi:hypothetical protein
MFFSHLSSEKSLENCWLLNTFLNYRQGGKIKIAKGKKRRKNLFTFRYPPLLFFRQPEARDFKSTETRLDGSDEVSRADRKNSRF